MVTNDHLLALFDETDEHILRFLKNDTRLSQWIHKPLRNDGWTFIMEMAHRNRLPIVEYLIEDTRVKIDLSYTTPSGATLVDVIEPTDIAMLQLITGFHKRQERLVKGPIYTGYHETSRESFEYIVADAKQDKYPMVGGKEGYFGGGIYFTKTPHETALKALRKGFGMECELRMGNILKVADRDHFAQLTIQMDTPMDVMRHMLDSLGYDSIWGYYDASLDEHRRILKTGDEYVVYSASQVTLKQLYIVYDPNLVKYHTPERPIWTPLKQPLIRFDPTLLPLPKDGVEFATIQLKEPVAPTLETLELERGRPFSPGTVIEFLHERFIPTPFLAMTPVGIVMKTPSYSKLVFYHDILREHALVYFSIKFNYTNPVLGDEDTILIFSYGSMNLLFKHTLTEHHYLHSFLTLVAINQKRFTSNYQYWIEIPSVFVDWSVLRITDQNTALFVATDGSKVFFILKNKPERTIAKYIAAFHVDKGKVVPQLLEGIKTNTLTQLWEKWASVLNKDMRSHLQTLLKNNSPRL